MPSYYDSKKKKPGKADMQYNKGGKVRRSDPEKRESVRSRAAKKSEGVLAGARAGGGARALRRKNAMREMKKQLGAHFTEREQDLIKSSQGLKERHRLGAHFTEREQDLIRASQGMNRGGKVKKMKGGGTVARGSGAARPQAFRKNG